MKTEGISSSALPSNLPLLNNLYIASLPRSGSTMLQAVLSQHPDVATRSEPWVELLTASFYRPDLLRARFDWQLALEVIDRDGSDDCNLEKIIAKLESVAGEIRETCIQESHGKAYYVDKTPRYYFILDELYARKPEAKFIILKRNPLSVFTSIYNSWLKDRWAFERWHYYSYDLLEGPLLVQEFAARQANSHNVRTLDYEKLIRDPTVVLKELFDWLELDFDEDFLSYNRNVSYQGRYGDEAVVNRAVLKPTRIESYKKIDESFRDRRVKKLALGLDDYYKKNLPEYSCYNEWLGGRPTNEFKAYKYLHDIRRSEVPSRRDCLNYIMFSALARIGL